MIALFIIEPVTHSNNIFKKHILMQAGALNVLRVLLGFFQNIKEGHGQEDPTYKVSREMLGWYI